ncbi:hypothetical protein TTHERM_00196310 (macronuclear) [Tetrahymena thermophila SB210]|uniref:Carboxymuconolactone decarboxylase family protein n=1 Tax=Tetrahymena thermophila (strain SB210) TaxID=312017 RepID=Q23K03_TETTS|nr:hypothetical protein TTHERM_00196310 [Tetrahymena thermophila SB210]EAR97040.1 hypothetical protein TTHERM_00196310 [Tetrahymena thermophila SB210]|eukprot:XP_001017285.1 hypothetical protein TTHERM_00196310 [Tetrahymena thermophila SB210]
MTEQKQKQVFEKIEKHFGFLPNLFKNFDGFPVGAEAFATFASLIIEHTPENKLPLLQPEIEYLGVKTSEENQCKYCQTHHQTALQQLLKDASNTIPENKRAALDNLAHIIAKEPHKAGNDVLKNKFKEAGYTDAQFKHAVMVVNVFCVSNRWNLANSTGIEENFNLIYKLG